MEFQRKFGEFQLKAQREPVENTAWAARPGAYVGATG
jgi:hypothetical protein